MSINLVSDTCSNAVSKYVRLEVKYLLWKENVMFHIHLLSKGTPHFENLHNVLAEKESEKRVV